MKKIEGIATLHGKEKLVEFDELKIIVVPIYHPSAMMYRPSLREDFENDFKTMAKIIGKKFKNEEKQKSLKEFEKQK